MELIAEAGAFGVFPANWLESSHKLSALKAQADRHADRDASWLPGTKKDFASFRPLWAQENLDETELKAQNSEFLTAGRIGLNALSQRAIAYWSALAIHEQRGAPEHQVDFLTVLAHNLLLTQLAYKHGVVWAREY